MVFVAVLVAVLSPYFLFIVRPEDQDQRKLKKRLKESGRKRLEKAAIVKDTEQLSSVRIVDKILGQATRIVVPLQRFIERSGVRMTPAVFLLMTGCAAGVPWLLVTWTTGHALVASCVAAGTGAIPYLWLRRATTKRLRKFEEQFPEGIDLIARALRAGHTFQTGLSMVADEIEAPVGTEFRLLFDRQNFGMPITEALRSFAERVPLLDAKFFATAVLTQRDAGGNMAEVLDNLSCVIRDRFKVKRQVRVISAHGRITGWILAGLPPALSTLFLLVSPKHMQTLFTDPLGRQMIAVAILLQVLGTVIIRKIVDIEY
jgi:tight adherence protein B